MLCKPGKGPVIGNSAEATRRALPANSWRKEAHYPTYLAK